MAKYPVGLFLTFILWFPLIVPAAPGDVDLSFNAGVISSQFQQDRLTAIAVQPDGRILIGGLFNSVAGAPRNGLARLNPDGSVDTSFVPPPFSQSDLVNPYKIAVQPDGKIVVAGNNFRIGNVIYQLIRLNADGSLDASFSLLPINAFRGIEGLALQTDGKILIGGDFTFIDGVERKIAARLNPNGSLDTTFSIGLPAPAHDGRAAAFAIQPDGKIIAGGALFMTVGTMTFANVVRLNSNGTPDTAFSVAGDSLDSVQAVIRQSDGKFLLAGSSSGNAGSRNSLTRVNPDGSVDSSFNSPVSLGGQIYDIVLEPSGKVIAVGNFCTAPIGQGCAIARFNTNGSRDTFYPFNAACGTQGPDNDTLAVVRQPDGKILVGGRFFNVSCVPRQRIVRLQNNSKAASDYDGDGRTDLSVFRPSNATWYLSRTTAGFAAQQFGIASDKLVPADYDGDGKTDVAVWREAPQAAFYIFQSATNTIRFEQFGQTGDDATVVGDFDGDGKTDPAVFRNADFGAQSYFFYRGSLSNPSGNITYLPWGTNGDKALRGDFDGDGKADAAVFRQSDSIWYVRRSSDGAMQAQKFGLTNDTRVAADYDGDGKTDVAVFRPSDGNWYVSRSSSGSLQITNWGISGDVAVPGDYDGDGQADFAVYRNGIWYLRQTAGGIGYGYFGLNSDIPTNRIQ